LNVRANHDERFWILDMASQRFLEIRILPFGDEVLCEDAFSQILGEIQQQMATNVARRMDVNNRVDAHILETSVAKQTRQLSADEEIDPVPARVLHEKLDEGSPCVVWRITDDGCPVDLVKRNRPPWARERYGFRNDLFWAGDVGQHETGGNEIEGRFRKAGRSSVCQQNFNVEQATLRNELSRKPDCLLAPLDAHDAARRTDARCEEVQTTSGAAPDLEGTGSGC
jgi:hypothetical protein